MTDTAPELAIPTDTLDSYMYGTELDRDEAEEDVRVLAAPVVAAELRRLAGGRELGGISYRDLLARADELDPPTAGKD